MRQEEGKGGGKDREEEGGQGKEKRRVEMHRKSDAIFRKSRGETVATNAEMLAALTR